MPSAIEVAVGEHAKRRMSCAKLSWLRQGAAMAARSAGASLGGTNSMGRMDTASR